MLKKNKRGIPILVRANKPGRVHKFLRPEGTDQHLAERIGRAERFGVGQKFDGMTASLQVIIKDDDGFPRCYLLRDPSLLIGGDWVRDTLGLIDPSRLCNLTTRSDEAWRGHMADAMWMPKTRMRKFSPDILHVEIIRGPEIEEFDVTWSKHETRPIPHADW